MPDDAGWSATMPGWTEVDLAELVNAYGCGGLMQRAIGARFYGQKDGTWREVTALSFSGCSVLWFNQRGRKGLCSSATLLAWVDAKRPVLVPVRK